MESNDRRMQSESEPVDNEYYNFLHVSRNATPEEITAAYKKLSRLYHPDKHIEEQKKQQALIMFTKLKNFYEGKQFIKILHEQKGTTAILFSFKQQLSLFNRNSSGNIIVKLEITVNIVKYQPVHV